MQPDGRESKALTAPVERSVVSPDEQWVLSEAERVTQATPMAGGNPRTLCTGCRISWGADGRSMLFRYSALMGKQNVTVLIPCQPGILPAVPASGFAGPDEAAKFPGALMIASDDRVAAAAGVYAYTETNRHSNIFRITLP